MYSLLLHYCHKVTLILVNAKKTNNTFTNSLEVKSESPIQIQSDVVPHSFYSFTEQI